jgi:hypothetical protein
VNTPSNFPPTKPDLRVLLDSTEQRTMAQTNCHQVGQIVSFDATKQTVSVQLQVLAVLADGSQVPYPLLTDCPVFVYSGGAAFITMPIAAGDPCLVLFNDRDLDNWFTTGNVVAPNSPRTHSLSDGLVLVGFRNLSNVIAGYSTTDVVIGIGTGKVAVKPDGTIGIANANGSVTVNADGSVTIVTTSGAFFKITTAGKLDLSIGGATFGAAMDALFTALTTWVNTGGTTPNPATVTALNAAKTLVDALLV